MTVEELQQYLEQAFGDLAAPDLQEVSAAADLDGFEDAVRTGTGRAKRWQELRPLPRYQRFGLAIFILTPRAWQYYLPAYLYAMTHPEVIWRYLSSVLDTLWYEDEYGDVLPSHSRGQWEARTALLTDRQRRCIAHCLVHMLRTINDSSAELNEVNIEAERVEHMLKQYWSAWLQDK